MAAPASAPAVTRSAGADARACGRCPPIAGAAVAPGEPRGMPAGE